MEILIVKDKNSKNTNNSKWEKVLTKSLKAYENDYKRAETLVRVLDSENLKRTQQRISDFQKLSLFGKA